MTALMSSSPEMSSEWDLAPPTRRQRSIDLLELQNQRWEEGCPSPVEDFLAHDREASANSEIVLDLIYNEVRLREVAGETPDLDDYRRRFPELRELLDLQFEVHKAMRPGEILRDLSLGEPDAGDFRLARPLPFTPGYDVLAELGRGAMGVVYKARHLRLNRLVALKMILAGEHAGPRERERFEAEARAIARLRHPHIVQIYEFGENEGRPFVCLELATGGNLAQRLQKQPLSPPVAAALLEMLARAVQYAHDQHIVHRDLKPGNILLEPSDEHRGVLIGGQGKAAYFEPKIADFGLAKLLDAQQDNEASAIMVDTDRPVGTPPYMAPEQAGRVGRKGQSASGEDGRPTDIYALGAILYELLTGRPPFLGATVIDTLQQVVAREPVAPRHLQPSVPRDLETICLACLRKQPHRRYASALDLAADLRRFLDDKPIQQRRPAFWEPPLRWARRRPAAAAWVALGMAAALTAIVGGLYFLNHKDEWARTRVLSSLRQFRQARDEALFQGAVLATVATSADDWTAIDVESSAAAVQRALVRADMDDRAEPGLAHSPYLTATEQTELRESCYELLLVLAQASGQPRPGLSRAESQTRAQTGLQILDRAARLGHEGKAWHLWRAELLSKTGDATAAAQEKRRAEELPPASASDFFLTGLTLWQTGDVDKASACFTQALRLQPNHFEAQYFLARAALDEGKATEARIGLTACIAQRPDFAWTYLLRGLALVDLEAWDEAQKDFTAAADLNPGDTVHYAALVNRGRNWMRQAKFAEAEGDLTAAIALRPLDFHAHFQLAQVRDRTGRYADANREYEAAMGLRPDLALIPRQRGSFRNDRNELEAALSDFQQAIKLELAGARSPRLAGDYVSCGGILNAQKHYAQAVAYYDLALKLDPVRASAWYLRGDSLLAQKQFADAEQSFTQCLAVDGEYDSALRGRGAARMALGDFPGALEDYAHSARIKRTANILTHRGWAYFFSEAWRLAEHDFNEAVQIEAPPGNARIGRGLARAKLGSYRAAVLDAREALSRHGPGTPDMMNNIACIFAEAARRVRLDVAEVNRAELELEYRRQAIETLDKTLALVPPAGRVAYWEKTVSPDPWLDSIRASPEFVRLDARVRKTAPAPEIMPRRTP
jgi:eukaryotic-like serine/threonine-protein kinase